ncbi:TIR domain-containing protein [Nocardia sp. CA-136227]|uniref:nSTAND1 domain-containing NTPase n=1 Tax=Nocardia sp. CA-136227 TaxID=3239979 RepID=UPI003D9698F4
MTRIFLSHSSRDNRAAIALKQWMAEQDPTLADEVFLDLDRRSGIRPGIRWKDALTLANARCEAVVCLLSRHWEASPECRTEFRTAESLHKPIYCLRLEELDSREAAGDWQQVDLFGGGPTTAVRIESGDVVEFRTEGLRRLWDALQAAGISAEHFPWPPAEDPTRAPYRGWEPFDAADAAVYFGRDTQIVRGMDTLRGMRSTGVEKLFVVLGPSGVGKSSFLRSGLLPRLARDDRRFLVLDIVRPERAAITGPRGFAHAVHTLAARLGVRAPTLGSIKDACMSDVGAIRSMLLRARGAATERQLDLPAVPPTLVLPIDQAEELFNSDAGPEAERLLRILAELIGDADSPLDLIVAMTIRADRYEPLQTAPALATLQRAVFDELRPLMPAEFADVIRGPAARATESGSPLRVHPDLIERLLRECEASADPLPLLSLTLARLYTDYGSSGELTVADYKSMGGMARVVESEIDSILSRDEATRAGELQLLHETFVPWLASIDPDTDQPRRRVARLSELPPDARPLIDAFVARRLLISDDREGSTVVEVALESLLRHWKTLADWLRDEREDLQAADSIERAADGWERSGHDDAWLLQGTRLADAEALVDKPRYGARLADAHTYLSASRAREDEQADTERRRKEAELETAISHAKALRTRARILQALLATTLVVALVAAVNFVGARSAEREAQGRFREATAARLVSDAGLMLNGGKGRDDVRAIEQVLAAQRISSSADPGALLRTVNALAPTEKIIKTGLPYKPTFLPPVEEIRRAVEVAEPVMSVALSRDGHRIATGGTQLRVWDADTGARVDLPFRTEHGAGAVAYSPDGRTIASTPLGEGSIQLWDANTGMTVGESISTGKSPAEAVAFSPDGHRVAAAGTDGTIGVWDVATRLPRPVLKGHDGAIHSIAFSGVGNRLVSGGADGTVRIWDLDTGEQVGEPMRQRTEIHSSTPDRNGVMAVAFSGDGHRVASGIPGGITESIALWDAESHQLVGQPLEGPFGAVTSLAFSPDSHRIVSGGTGDSVRLWDVETGKQIGPDLRGHTGAVKSVAYGTIDGRGRIVSAAWDGTMRVWRDDRQDGAGFEWDQSRLASVGPPGGRMVVMAPDGRRMMVADPSGVGMSVVDLDRGTMVRAQASTRHGTVVDADYSEDGRRIAVGLDDQSIVVFDADSGQVVRTITTGFGGAISTLELSTDSRRIAAGSEDKSVKVWDVESGEPIGAPLTGLAGAVKKLAFSPNEDRLAVADADKSVWIWDLDSARLIGGPLKGQKWNVQYLSFGADGRRVIAGGGGSVTLWDADSGRQVSRTDATFTVDQFAISPSGRFFVVAQGLELQRFDALTGNRIGGPMQGHTDAMVTGLAVTPDNRYILSGGADQTLRFWSADTGEPVGDPLKGSNGWILQIRIAPDGRTVRTVWQSVNGSQTGFHVWPGPAAWVDELCSKLTAEVTDQQWSEWVSDKIGYEPTCHKSAPAHP